MRGGFRGEWWTDSGHSGGGIVLLLIAAAILFGSGAAAAIATAVLVALIAAGAVLVLAVAGLAALLVYRTRHGQGIVRPSVIITSPDRAPLPPATAPAALEPPRPQIVNNFFGVTPDEVAEILRRQQAE